MATPSIYSDSEDLFLKNSPNRSIVKPHAEQAADPDVVRDTRAARDPAVHDLRTCSTDGPRGELVMAPGGLACSIKSLRSWRAVGSLPRRLPSRASGVAPFTRSPMLVARRCATGWTHPPLGCAWSSQ